PPRPAPPPVAGPPPPGPRVPPAPPWPPTPGTRPPAPPPLVVFGRGGGAPAGQPAGSAPAPASLVASRWLPTSTVPPEAIVIESLAIRTSGRVPAARKVAVIAIDVPASTQ